MRRLQFPGVVLWPDSERVHVRLSPRDPARHWFEEVVDSVKKNAAWATGRVKALARADTVAILWQASVMIERSC